MNDLIVFLLRTTALTPLSIFTRKSSPRLELQTKEETKSGIHRVNGSKASASSAILIGQTIKVPILSQADLSKIASCSAKLITRHMDKKHLQNALQGGFKFGTIAGYRPADNAQIGRFSDCQEGLLHEVYQSRDGIYNLEKEGSTIKDVTIVGFENPITFQFYVNDYCSCSSRNGFSLDRAILFRERGNPDISAYVVYDLEKLIAAIKSVCAEQPDKLHLSIIARDVEYGYKDRRWEIVGHFRSSTDRDHMTIWLKTIFIKSHDYQHEDEIRIILTDTGRAGQLPENSEGFLLNDRRIADAIVEHGAF